MVTYLEIQIQLQYSQLKIPNMVLVDNFLFYKIYSFQKPLTGFLAPESW